MRAHHCDGAAALGPVTPESDEARELGSVAGFKDHGTADRFDCDGVQTGRQQAVNTKRFATLQAHFALAGWALSGGGTNDDGGPFLASRWGRSVELATIAEGEAFANRVGAP